MVRLRLDNFNRLCFLLTDFNSTMVRLRFHIDLIEHLFIEFQFHYGTIKVLTVDLPDDYVMISIPLWYD